MFSSNVYNIWEEIKNGEVNHFNVKRYIKIQFRRLGINSFDDIVNITNTDIEYYNILLIIIAYYNFEFVSKKMCVKNI